MASIRRQVRRRPGRPELLSSLPGSQLELVHLLGRRPGVSVAEAAEELQLAPNTVSTLVRQLTEAGYVDRSLDPSDRRVAHLELAPATRKLVEQWRDRRAVTLGRAVSRLNPEERVRLYSSLPVLERLGAILREDLNE
jgi:DNA-binding MarR family transcriptional regulator